MRDIFYGREAREILKSGVDKLANAVKITLGPNGRNVVFDNKYKNPTITNDGVTIAKEVYLKGNENIGAQILKQSAIKTNDEAGDGTTTTIVLAQALIEAGNEVLNTQLGVNSVQLQRELTEASEEIIDSLKVITDIDPYQVALVSTGNPELSKLVTDVYAKVGKDGKVTLDDSQTGEDEIEISDGYEMDSGLVSPYLLDDDKTEFTDCPVLIVNQKLTEILPLLEQMVQDDQNKLMIIADEYDNKVIQELNTLRLNGQFNTIAIKSPGYVGDRIDTLNDIAELTGATVVSDKVGNKVSKDVLGKIDKVISDLKSTTIIGGDASKRIKELEKRKTDSTFDQDKLEDRIAKLSGKVAIIRVGGKTEIEQQERKYRVEDAVHAVKAALEEGVVEGGGLALYKLTPKTETNGQKILAKAIKAPYEQIVKNGYKLDPTTDLFSSGVVDPYKVTKNAIRNACSVSGAILTIETLMAEVKDAKPSTDNKETE